MFHLCVGYSNLTSVETLKKVTLTIVFLFFLQVGTSSVVYPAAMFAPRVARRGVPVAEFNTEETDATSGFG